MSLRGLLVGIVAGLLAFGFARTFGEPAVDVAIDFEAAHAEAERAEAIKKGITPAPEEPELFSRTVQSGVGLLTGVVVIGAGIGAIFGVLFAFANGRMDNLGPGATSTLLSFYALWSIYVIPALKYPANPPSVGEPDTIKLRTGLYFLIMAISIATTIGSLILRKRLVAKFGAWTGSVDRVRGVPRGDLRLLRHPARDRRGSGRFPGGHAVAIPDGVIGHSDRAVGIDRIDVRLAGRAVDGLPFAGPAARGDGPMTG